MTHELSSHSSPESSDVVTIEGVVKRSTFGIGTWTIVGMGRTVQIFHNQPDEILQDGLRVRAIGKIRADIMTTAMVGPVFEIDRFEPLEPEQ